MSKDFRLTQQSTGLNLRCHHAVTLLRRLAKINLPNKNKWCCIILVDLFNCMKLAVKKAESLVRWQRRSIHSIPCSARLVVILNVCVAYSRRAGRANYDKWRADCVDRRTVKLAVQPCVAGLAGTCRRQAISFSAFVDGSPLIHNGDACRATPSWRHTANKSQLCEMLLWVCPSSAALRWFPRK